MKKYSVIFIVILLMSLIFSGCTNEATNPNTGDPSVSAPEIDENGMLRLGAVGDITTLIGQYCSDSRSGFIIGLLFDSLLDFDENQQIIPAIAESWKVSDDGLELTFTLRDDVYFHDGEKVNADDVAYSINVILDEKYTGVRKSSVKYVDRVEAVNDRTFKMYLKDKDATIMTFLAGYSSAVLPKHIFEGTSVDELKKHEKAWEGIGTGPFKLKELVDGQYVVLEANENYYEDVPRIKTIHEKTFQDNQVLLAAFENGELDYMSNIPRNDIELLRSTLSDTVHFETYPTLSYRYIGLKQTHPIFKDKNVRHAMMYALDRHSIVDTVYLEYGQVINSHGVPAQWSYSPKSIDYKQNIEKANKMLDEAGWSKRDSDGIRMNDKGERFEFVCVTGGGIEDVRNVIDMVKEQWKSVGISMKIEEYELSVLFEQYLDAFNFEAYYWRWGLGFDPDPTNIFHSSSARDENGNPAGFNDVEIHNDELNRLIEAGRNTYDQAERTVIYHQVQELLNDELPYIFLCTEKEVLGVSKKVIDVVYNGLGTQWIKKWAIVK